MEINNYEFVCKRINGDVATLYHPENSIAVNLREAFHIAVRCLNTEMESITVHNKDTRENIQIKRLIEPELIDDWQGMIPLTGLESVQIKQFSSSDFVQILFDDEVKFLGLTEDMRTASHTYPQIARIVDEIITTATIRVNLLFRLKLILLEIEKNEPV